MKGLTKRILLFLVVSVAFAGPVKADSVNTILSEVYGTYRTACTQDIDADTGGHNRLTLIPGRRYLIYCHDGAGASVACTCLLGDSSVDASSSVGVLLVANEKITMRTTSHAYYLSCVPFVNNQYVDACPMN